MRGVLFLPLIAVFVVFALMTCGAAVEASPVGQDYEQMQANVEIPGTSPAVVQVVHDPGSCGDESATISDVNQLENNYACRAVRRVTGALVRLGAMLRGC
jgi:hypothetical protein